jgi:prolyl-tRNA synthetase
MRMADAVAGANKTDCHVIHVRPGRDFVPTKVADLRVARAGDPCARCGGELSADRGIEVGHVFKLGTKYSVTMGATFLDEKGERKPCIMGCYGIGVSRILAAVVEQNHDDKGIIWPRAVAPYEVAVLPLNTSHGESVRVAEDIYQKLCAAGIETILDDRPDRPGVKFNDADLVGFPLRVTVGEKSLAKGVIELKARAESVPTAVAPAEAVAAIQAKLSQLP